MNRNNLKRWAVAGVGFVLTLMGLDFGIASIVYMSLIALTEILALANVLQGWKFMRIVIEFCRWPGCPAILFVVAIVLRSVLFE